MSTHRKTTTITFLPMQTPALPPIPTPDAPAPAQDLITQLINQGGGTIIIQEEDTQSEDNTTSTTQISYQDTTTTQNTQYHEKQSPQPRASPNLRLLLYIILAAIALILMIRFSIRQ
jgi:type VI protein secretion system component VasF